MACDEYQHGAPGHLHDVPREYADAEILGGDVFLRVTHARGDDEQFHDDHDDHGGHDDGYFAYDDGFDASYQNE